MNFDMNILMMMIYEYIIMSKQIDPLYVFLV